MTKYTVTHRHKHLTQSVAHLSSGLVLYELLSKFFWLYIISVFHIIQIFPCQNTRTLVPWLSYLGLVYASSQVAVVRLSSGSASSLVVQMS